jgi:FkbM family methyltransferase
MKSLFKQIGEITGLKKRIDRYIEFRINNHIKNNFRQYYRNYEWNEIIKKCGDFIDIAIDGGLVIRCNRDSQLGKEIYIGEFENNELNYIKSLLMPGDIFIDIGANIGLFSLVAGIAVAETGKVYAFEPAKESFELLKENIILNQLPNINAINMAMGEYVDKLFLFNYRGGMDAFNSFSPVLKETEYNKTEVIVDTLSRFIKTLSVEEVSRIKLIKIDVEGWEIPVIKGGLDFLASSTAPNILVEFTESNAKASGYRCKDLYKLGESIGYTWYQITQNGLVHAKNIKNFDYINLIGIKNHEKQ